ncbi:S-layer protein [Thermococcus sp. SY098]|uniref:S-layer protein n=1 Tax=Thermococcus sp. SY098 TaxID=3111325 RepID=UPI002D781CE7|nr:S-layer protein [Thermococcus sp. SY098]WRS52601.1 S-layer protein [Thermococcus sp. SY098]
MKVRKIAALAVGAAMVGATMGFASAQANLPGKDFFVKDGQPNVKIVVGSQAAAMDVASAADIAVALGSLLYTEKEAEAAGVSVVVKKDLTPDYTYYIPVFSNYYEDTGTNPSATDWEQLTDNWWNGSAYNGSYTDWTSWTPKFVDEVSDMDAINGDYQVDWDFTISNIELSDPEQNTIAYVPRSADLTIPAGDFTVLLNYTIANWTYSATEPDSIWGTLNPSTVYDEVHDDDNPGGYTFSGYIYDGVGAGDTFTVLGNTYYILDVLTDGIKYGHDHGQVWFHVGDVKEFDGYKIRAVDISVSPSNKALFEITAPDGRSDLVIISTDEGDVDISTKSDKFEPGEVVLKLDDTFVGIDGNLIAQLEVRTNVVEVHTGDELVSGWVVNFTIENNKVKWLTLTNANDLSGSKLDILGKYTMCYKVESHTLEADDTTYYAAKAYIVVKPSEPIVKTEELKVGDELVDYDGTPTGWVVDQIKGGTYTEVTVMHPTEPITYLDTEIDPENIDSNLILVGGPVANAVTKYLVDNGYSKVDWYNSAGDIEYIEDYNGFGILIVAGKDRYATREAAKQLMEYLSSLS